MADLIPVDDPGDPRLADYVSLRDTQLRHSLEAEQGLFIAEGAKVIRRALGAGYPARSFLLAPRWIDDLRDLLDASDAPCYVVSEALAEQVTGFHVHRGALASCERIDRWTLDEVLAGDRLVVLEDLVDHSNVGAIIRSAAALGWDGLLVSERCADPLYRRAVKTSMGAVFSLPWRRIDDWAGAIPALKRAGFTVAALALRDDAITLAEFRASLASFGGQPGGALNTHVGARPVAVNSTSPIAKVALLFGSEGDGLTSRWIDEADVRVRIPMSSDRVEAGGIDSLNVAAAAAIACYELRAQV
ncbi:MAG: RNA methyltransferase [Propionibacteriaceae bacterium]|jgi:tRNA G18 (ribose-2'-O)-methylase SpoU|nr:RNA methyltransferase [Propionibacteriaceae bacterium]